MSNSVKEHYDSHLSAFYTWMTGDPLIRAAEFVKVLSGLSIQAKQGSIAFDLGAGTGIQTIALQQAGYFVYAVDFSEDLLNELRRNTQPENLVVVQDNILNVDSIEAYADLILCCGDTLTHLPDYKALKQFVNKCAGKLKPGGIVLFTFRDYTIELKGDDRFIPVKSDDIRILTCVLDYTEQYVTVTDLLYERSGSGWMKKISSYSKLRLSSDTVANELKLNGLRINTQQINGGVITITAEKFIL